ncbi:MAG TPA: glycerophosphodiester phosphodiesterase [Clostridiales bacterium]|nr:glycerophosphodiester phosphodiesterase [Clostridiales bacterium]
MRKRKKLFKSKLLWFFIILLAFIYINNSSLLVRDEDERPFLLAHRGLAQTFSMEGITGDTNTARIIYEPEHPYLENTIPSMKAAFELGADMVELDVQLTKDGQFAVFHDAVLEYRTDGQGSIRDYTMEELKKLDVGYGYTADDGKTYPFRGKGVGLMPSLDEVFESFPGKRLLLHIKSNDPAEGQALAEYLKKLPSERIGSLAAYGGDEPMRVLKQELPDLKVMSKASVKRMLVQYMLLGWTGYVPDSMKNTFFYLPEKYARVLWGWPDRFVERMKNNGTIFVLVAGSGEWSEGFDTVESLDELPKNYKGGIWTNRIDRIAPVYSK